MKVLSLFDGMACGMLAFQKSGIEVERYVAYEIDKYAIKVSTHNFPSIEQRGDVFDADFTEFEGFDFVVGGSPCTYWSIAQTKNRETEAHGIGWELFQQYVRAIREAKPKFFIYENNKSMSAAIREEISNAFGFEPIMINSARVSAQNRERLYWVGVRQNDGTYRKADIEQPNDRGILLKDVLDEGVTWKEKSHCIDANYFKGGNLSSMEKQSGKRLMVAEPVNGTEGCKAHTIKAQYYKNGIANFVTNGGFSATAVAEPVCLRYERTEEGKRLRKDYESGKLHHGYNEHRILQPRMDGKTNTVTTVQKDNMIADPICHMIPQEVSVRKYTCNIEDLKTLLRDNKTKSNREIAEALDKPVTMVEHWFRADNCFSVPDADVWFKLKELLGITSTEFDDFVTVFETRDGVFDKANRCYDPNGKMSTVMTCANDKVIVQAEGSVGNMYGKGQNGQLFGLGSKTKTLSAGTGQSGNGIGSSNSPKAILPYPNYDGEPVYEVKDGMINIKDKQYPIKLADGFYIIRKLTVSECKRLQTVPEDYDMSVISNTQAYKCLGNGWTVDVIVHLIKGALGDVA